MAEFKFQLARSQKKKKGTPPTWSWGVSYVVEERVRAEDGNERRLWKGRDARVARG